MTRNNRNKAFGEGKLQKCEGGWCFFKLVVGMMGNVRIFLPLVVNDIFLLQKLIANDNFTFNEMATILKHGDGSGGKVFCIVMQDENSTIITPLSDKKYPFIKIIQHQHVKHCHIFYFVSFGLSLGWKNHVH